MLVWMQIIFFIITNAPTLIKAIRDLIGAFNGDKKVAKEFLQDLHTAKKQKSLQEDLDQAFMDVLKKYQEKAAHKAQPEK